MTRKISRAERLLVASMAALAGIAYVVLYHGGAAPRFRPEPERGRPVRYIAPGPAPQIPSDAHSLAYGYQALRQSRLKDAEESFMNAAKDQPRSAEPHYGLAQVYLLTNRRTDAIDQLRISFRLDKTYVSKALADEQFDKLHGEEHFRSLLQLYNAAVPAGGPADGDPSEAAELLQPRRIAPDSNSQ